MTVTLFPDMFQIRTCNEHQVIVAYCFTVISDGTLYSGTVSNIIQFVFRVTVNGKVEC